MLLAFEMFAEPDLHFYTNTHVITIQLIEPNICQFKICHLIHDTCSNHFVQMKHVLISTYPVKR